MSAQSRKYAVRGAGRVNRLTCSSLLVLGHFYNYREN